MTATTLRHSWTDADRKTLRTLWNEGKTKRQISIAMALTFNQVDKQIGVMKKAGKLINRTPSPAALNKPKYASIAPDVRGFCPEAEAKMLQAVNAAGGFPLQRKIKIGGRTFAVLTTLDPHTPHPFQLARLAAQTGAAA